MRIYEYMYACMCTIPKYFRQHEIMVNGSKCVINTLLLLFILRVCVVFCCGTCNTLRIQVLKVWWHDGRFQFAFFQFVSFFWGFHCFPIPFYSIFHVYSQTQPAYNFPAWGCCSVFFKDLTRFWHINSFALTLPGRGGWCHPPDGFSETAQNEL